MFYDFRQPFAHGVARAGALFRPFVKKTEAPAAEPPAAEPPAEQPTEQAAAAEAVQAGDATAEKRTYKPIPSFVPTPETIDSKIGRLEFPGGYPSDETAQKLADEMLYVHGVSAYTNTIQGASLWAIRKGFADIGVKDNEFIVSPEMMDGRASSDRQYGHLLFLVKHQLEGWSNRGGNPTRCSRHLR